ncbi:MAG: hypothetical protein WCB67_04350 [Solirubrobacteraceae bacterium]
MLDTQTKGTGATMVPLESVLSKPGRDEVPGFVFPEPKPPVPAPAEAPAPLEFKVVDVMSRAVLAEHADTRAAVRALASVHSIVDVTIYVWEPARERWRRLTFGEARALWNYRGQADSLVAE